MYTEEKRWIAKMAELKYNVIGEEAVKNDQ